VLTGGYDLARTNANLNETVLSPATVQPSRFGKLFTLPVDGQIAAQPLYEQSVPVAGHGVHNVVFVATEHNSVYAFDADMPSVPLWTVNLGPSVPSSVYNWASTGPYQDIAPEIGILGTPVIDPVTGTLYAVAATMENGAFYFRLHALDTGSGAERFGGPSTIAARVAGAGDSSTGGMVDFVPGQHIQRPALLLLNGVVYVAFGSHGDGRPWHGWMMGYSASNVRQQTAVFNATANGWGGAIWQSGRGPSVDSQGDIYLVTSNGDSDDVADYSDSVLRLDPGTLAIRDWFAPSDQETLDDDDDDLGTAGAVMIPGTGFLVTGGKQGYLYLLNTASLGHLAAGNSSLPESFSAVGFGVFNMALWNRSDGPLVYLLGSNSPFSAYRLTGSQIGTNPVSQSSSAYLAPLQGMTISANGGQPESGILWATTAATWPLPSTGTLHAFNADDLSSELWNSSMNPDADGLGGFSKFANPTVANGKVYTPDLSNELVVYGVLNPGGPAPVITGLVNAASYANGAVAPGEIVTIFGQNLGPAVLAAGAFDQAGDLNLELAGIEVTFNGVPAPLLYVSAEQLAAVVPFETAPGTKVAVQVGYSGQVSATQTFNVAPSAPGIFTADASGSGPGAVLNQDYSLNSESNPAPGGSIVMVYATGGGVANPVDMTGATAQGPVPLAAAATAAVGGQPAQVLYAGDVPDEVAGMVQVNVRLPDGVTGTVPVVLTIGGVASQATATVAIAGARPARR